jgi:hypothetical protein
LQTGSKSSAWPNTLKPLPNDIDFRRPDTFSGPLVYTFADGPMPTIMIMSRALAE